MNVDKLMHEVASDVQDISEQQFRALTLQVASEIVIGTPVDEGTARASWNISVGRPDRSKNAPDKTRTVNSSEVKFNPKLKPYYITSPLPYMQRLEFTHSTYAGWIRAALARNGLI